MRTIIAGSREGATEQDVENAVNTCGWIPTVIISGTARGADKLGELWAEKNNLDIVRMPANWDLHGKSAGYKRNAEMAAVAEALIALWDGKSKGTKHMIDLALANNLKVHIYYLHGAELI